MKLVGMKRKTRGRIFQGERTFCGFYRAYLARWSMAVELPPTASLDICQVPLLCQRDANASGWSGEQERHSSCLHEVYNLVHILKIRLC